MCKAPIQANRAVAPNGCAENLAFEPGSDFHRAVNVRGQDWDIYAEKVLHIELP
jgi:hypothetical protein